MEPVHPADMEETWTSIIIILVLYAILFITIDSGAWVKFVRAAVEWFPYWHWGG